MRILTEREAEEFLEKNDFEVVRRAYVSDSTQLKMVAEKLGYPLAMKVSGKEIVHKNTVGGVVINVKDFKMVEGTFDKLMKIEKADGVMVQKQIKGKEFLLGIKKTPEFGHVIGFGTGGIHTEKLKDVVFRVCPFDKKEIRRMIQEVEIGKDLDGNDFEIIKKNILKLCKLVKKYPRTKELDINPLISGKIIDARIVFA
jgi:acetate---CoA ligase (ADP-forming)